ncbi:beta-ketoacyl-ACP synthase III [Sphingobacterium spiritivorum]|uniref:beta-ketoacyl-ACP synthase III n=1 Tax=Sphingobacterium spiritivorum TaxID=258 RepID=UPI001917B513|nr:beta-ketoacyl-ACP synthase III [Sphingobacterium spiritivorum]QQT26949.1 ketoacyl-ACP synthase III [Sphingobacterium spiritivorum]
MSKIHAAITAVNGYVPDYVLTNKELETMVDTNDEWIVSRTGIKERRILKGEGKATSDLAVPAVLGLLKKRGITAEEIDLIVFCTSTPDMLFPATANILADKIGAKNAWGFDLQAACSGFLFGLNTASQFIISGTHKKVLVVGADKMSSVVNYKDRNTCILFGDGCGAVLLEPNEEGMGIQDAILKTDGSGGQYLNIKGGGSLNPATHETVDAEMHYAYQEGRTVFKFAVTNMADVAAEIMDKNNLTSADINWLVPHQANKRIIDATAERVGLPEEKVMVNIQKYGNTTSATIPMCLWEWESQLKKGDNLILAAFGGGFTWGSIYLKWAY